MRPAISRPSNRHKSLAHCRFTCLAGNLLFLSFPQAGGAPVMKRAALARVLVVGVGNPGRGDDGIGPLVVRQLLGRVSPDVVIVERSGDALTLVDDWEGRDAVILVDAAAPGGTPGSIHRIDLLRDVWPREVSLSSTHGFGLVEAVGLAGALDLLPPQVIAYAIEGANFDPGAPISPQVAAVTGEVAAELKQLAGEADHA
jgi:hydrogenase maturation protease